MATTNLEKIPLTTLRLMIPSTWDAYQDSCEWAILDRQYHVIRRGKDLLNALPHCNEVEIIVPASMVGFIPAQLPPSSQNKVLGALAYLVESNLITPPEDTHAVLAGQSGSQIMVAVINKAWVSIVLEKFSRVDIFPNRMFSETVLPELPPNGWAVVCRGRESFIRTDIVQGICIDMDISSDTPPLLLMLALQKRETSNLPATITWYGEDFQNLNSWATQLGVTVTSATQQEWFVNPNKSSLNLLQGEFQPSGGVARQLLAFKAVAITLAVLFTLQFSLTLLDFVLKANENRKLDHAILSQFKTTFPNANTVVDAPLQMERNLEELKHGAGQNVSSDYIPLLATVTSSIGAVSAEKLKGMNYEQGKLVLILSLPSLDHAEDMRGRLNGSNLLTTLETVRQTDQGIDLLLTVSASVP